ncbi:hypothetical protein GGQ97_002330 [Sphingomonas kaistensis]|uniref:Uncharacterized protein n=1 Tax=Sphingomonas kaistensis TaxID=298708 RepID=A0A7X5Y7D2_9SPHN|nr:hypothetical protein [Sphingomonas kaistensis]NJC06537.1 hypothetical protein [Sphingomonas kaistensis]
MIGADQIAAEFVAQIDEQLGRVGAELATVGARLVELEATVDGLQAVRARLLGEAAVLTVAEARAGATADERPKAAAHPFPLPMPADPDQPARAGKPHRDAWTVGEEQILRDLYPTEGVEGCKARLPHRKERAIMIRASRLGLQTETKRPPVRKNGWQEAENAVIRAHYPAGGPQACVDHLPGRTVDTIRQQARKIGVKLDAAVLAERRAEGGRRAQQTLKAAAAPPVAAAPQPAPPPAPKPFVPVAPPQTITFVPKMPRAPELPDDAITDVDHAKSILARRHAPVCSMAVHGGSSILFQVGQAKNVPLKDLLEMAERERQREREKAAA